VRTASLRLTYPRLLFFLVLLGMIVGGWAVDLWLLAALGLWGSGRLALASAFPRVRLGLRLTRSRLFAGERAYIEVRLINPSWWPIPWIEVESRQNEDLVGGLRRAQWLPGGAMCTLRAEWFAPRRGVYRVGGFWLRAGDWFGLFHDEREVSASLDLVVYPRVQRLEIAPTAPRLPEGPRRDLGSPFEDDLPAGLRAYRPGDSRRRIAWRASARHGDLLVREMPPVREVVTYLCLDLRPDSWHDAEQGPERAISLAASLACAPILGGRPLGCCAFAATAVRGTRIHNREGPGRLLWLPPRRGAADRRPLLELLAAVEPERASTPAFPDLLRAVAPRLPWGAQSIWILPEDLPEVRALAAVWQGRGHPVTLLCLDRRQGPAASRIGGATVRTWEVGERAGFTFR